MLREERGFRVKRYQSLADTLHIRGRVSRARGAAHAMNRRSHAARRSHRTTVPVLLATLAALGLALPTAATELREVRVGAHDGFTRVVFELDRSAGYRIERVGTPSRPELRVTLEASSGPLEAGAHGDVRGVKVAPGAKAVATIPLRRQDLRLQEMILANPPRIVLDLKRSAPAPTAAKPAAKPVAKAPAPAPKPAPEAAPKPALAPERVAKAPAIAKPTKPAAEPKPAPKPEARPEPVAVKPAPKPAHEPKLAPKPERTPLEIAKPVERPEPAAKPAAEKPSAAPATPEAVAKRTEETTAQPIADAAEPAPLPATDIARRVERGTRPAPERAPARVAKPTPSERTARPAPAPAPEPGLLERLTGDPLMLGAAAGGLVALVGIAITLRRRRRALPGDLDADAIAAELDGGDADAALPVARAEAPEPQAEASDEDGPFADLFDAAPSEAPATEPVPASDPHDVFATPNLDSAASGEPSEEPGPPPVAGPEFDVEAPSDFSTAPDSIFDDASQGEAPMNQDMDLPADRSPFDAPPAGAPSMGGASPDVAQMLEAFERRIQGLEQKLEEASEAREKLERQVAAQSEELRVQRAAIARTQRALRTMSRGDEDKATEPALREGEAQAKTRVNV